MSEKKRISRQLPRHRGVTSADALGIFKVAVGLSDAPAVSWDLISESAPGSTYFTVQFQGVNAQGFGDYSDGLIPVATPAEGRLDEVPGCVVADDLEYLLGNPAEARLAAALYYRDNGSCPSAAAGAGAAEKRVVDPVLLKGEQRQIRVMPTVD